MTLLAKSVSSKVASLAVFNWDSIPPRLVFSACNSALANSRNLLPSASVVALLSAIAFSVSALVLSMSLSVPTLVSSMSLSVSVFCVSIRLVKFSFSFSNIALNWSSGMGVAAGLVNWVATSAPIEANKPSTPVSLTKAACCNGKMLATFLAVSVLSKGSSLAILSASASATPLRSLILLFTSLNISVYSSLEA